MREFFPNRATDKDFKESIVDKLNEIIRKVKVLDLDNTELATRITKLERKLNDKK